MSSEVTKRVLDHHMATLHAGDVEAIMSDYAPDAVFISGTAVLTGAAAIRAVFANVKPGAMGDMVITKEEVHGEIAYIAWKTDRVAYGTDTFVVRDGKIVAQTVGMHIG